MRFVLDTGMEGSIDGMFASKLFNRLLKEHPTIGPDLNMVVADGRAAYGKIFPQLNLAGQNYTTLWFIMVDPPKAIKGLVGLGFLTRHKVTANFPKHTLYLKCLSPGPVTEKSLSLHSER
jgi:hypothetical protein